MIVALAVGCGSDDRGRPNLDDRSDARAAPRAADAATLDGGLVPWAVTPFPEVVAPADNPTTDAKVALGRLLFYDPIVSVDHQTACGTCHSEFWGMSDGLAVSVGHGGGLLAGPGRSGPNQTRRNAMTLWNVAYRSTAFWDGRAASLEDQVHFPFDSKAEFSQSLDTVVAAIGAIPGYVDLFAAAFPGEPEPVTGTTFARAIAAFERTLVTNHGLYESYLGGDVAAFSDSMTRGMRLFAEGGCATCHVPPLFSSERFEDRGVDPIPGVADAGRFEVTGDEADRNRFKVPTLRNAHDTGPFFHTGAMVRLEDAVRHEADFSAAHDGTRPLSDAEVSDISTFLLKALIDTRESPTRPLEVPSGLPIPIDGFNIQR